MPEHASVESLSLRLRWLWRVRWVEAACLAALTLLVHFGLGLSLPWRALLVLAGVIGIHNIVFRLALGMVESRRGRGRQGRALRFEDLAALANFQIGLDLVLLTAAFHLSGGIENPFIVFYLVPPIMASVLLTLRSSMIQAAWATALFLGMGVCEAVWPSLHHHVGGYLAVEVFNDWLLLTGEVVAVGVSVHVCVYLAGTIAGRLHRRERQLRATRDALERRSAELAQAVEDLQVLEERRARLLQLTAHQLRGPLAATEGCLAMACEGYAPPGKVKQADWVRRARTRIQGMLQIVRDLLALAGTHELTERARMTRLGIDELASNVVEQYSDFAASRQIDLVCYPGAHGAEVLGDPRALGDALGNLVSNAIKYTKEGGHVKVATRMSQDEVVCEVIDDGIGIPERERGRLFQEFFRASNARASGQEGTGLGLSIVKAVAEKHGGRFKIESLENLGTCAVISLPRAAAPHETPAP